MNINFYNNKLEFFLNECRHCSLVIIGNNNETKQFINAIMKKTNIEPIGQIDVTSETPIYKKMTIEDLVGMQKDQLVILITDKHPFVWQKRLINIGINNYFSSYMFVEHFLFENNTNLCYFYLNE